MCVCAYACEKVKHDGEVATPHRGEKTTQPISQEVQGWVRQEEAVQPWEDKRWGLGGWRFTDQGGVTTQRHSDQVWDGLKYSDSERLQKLERPDEIVNLVFGPQRLR